MKKYLFLILGLSLCLSSCQKGGEPNNSDGKKWDLLISCEALMNSNNSTIAAYSMADNELMPDLFLSRNNRKIGDQANDIKVYGSKIYCVTTGSSTLEVMDKTGKSLSSLSLTYSSNGQSVAKEPRRIAFAGNKAYVCCFDGTVVRIDTTSLRVDGEVTCGKNPDGICVANGRLYVANSGGKDYVNYDNTVSVIDLSTFTQIQKITVNTNPGKILADPQGNLYLITRGNYTNISGAFQKIDSKTEKVVKTFPFEVTNFDIHNGKLYLFNYDWVLAKAKIFVIDSSTDQIVAENFITDNTQIVTPYGINVDPATENVYLTDVYDYKVMGDLYCFSSAGKLQYKIASVGQNPNNVAFLK